jgi:hypothetical protein
MEKEPPIRTKDGNIIEEKRMFICRNPDAYSPQNPDGKKDPLRCPIGDPVPIGPAGVRAEIYVKFTAPVPGTRSMVSLLYFDANGNEIKAWQSSRTARLMINKVDYGAHALEGKLEGQEEEWKKATTATRADDRTLVFGMQMIQFIEPCLSIRMGLP